MENASYALRIAAGVLIAVMVIGVLIFVWKQIAIMEDTTDKNQVSLVKSEFNQAFLAYDKSLMYGTDVLSCLNKAQNNNQRYVYNNYYGTDTATIGSSVREEYFVNVKVELKSDLEENLIAYYRDSTGTVRQFTNGTFFNKYIFKDDNSNDFFELPTVTYYYFNKNEKLVSATDSYSNLLWGSSKNTIKVGTQTMKTKIVQGTYQLLTNEDVTTSTENKYATDNTAAQLSALLSTVTTPEQTIYNSLYNDTGMNNWYKITWRTAVYDFKTRKFKCTSVHYADTGYIDEICFVEI